MGFRVVIAITLSTVVLLARECFVNLDSQDVALVPFLTTRHMWDVRSKTQKWNNNNKLHYLRSFYS